MRFEELENPWGLFLEQFWRKIGCDDFDNLWQFRKFGAKPCAARADFEHAAGKLEAALLHEERNEARQIISEASRPLLFCAEFMDWFTARFAQRDHPLMRIGRAVAFFLN